jgi:hypothetical protein
MENKNSKSEVHSQISSSVSVPSFSTSEVRLKENSFRERAKEREARAKSLFSEAKSIKYLGALTEVQRKALASGSTLETPAGKLSLSETKAAACLLCGGIHDLKSPDRSILIRWFQVLKSKTVFALSDSCREKYFQPFAQLSLENLEVYRGDFPKAPVKA